jgi:hypothetical protein
MTPPNLRDLFGARSRIGHDRAAARWTEGLTAQTNCPIGPITDNFALRAGDCRSGHAASSCTTGPGRRAGNEGWPRRYAKPLWPAAAIIGGAIAIRPARAITLGRSAGLLSR